MKKIGKKLLLICFGILFINLVSANNFPTTINLNLQIVDDSGNLLVGSYVINFSISNDSLGNTILFSQQDTLTTDSRAIISNYTLNVSNVDFSKYPETYLIYRRNNIIKSAQRISAVPYSFYSNNSANLNGKSESNLNVNSSKYSNNWSTNNGTLSGINTTQMENNNGILNLIMSFF